MRNARMGCGLQNSALGVAMGRSFESIRMEVRDVTATAMAYNETIINHALAFLFYPIYSKSYMLLVG
jgi:hypothetical protein